MNLDINLLTRAVIAERLREADHHRLLAVATQARTPPVPLKRRRTSRLPYAHSPQLRGS